MIWTSGTVVAIVAFISASLAIMVSSWALSRHVTASRSARAEVTAGREYRGLADEFRRLSDMAITAQEHVDLRLTDRERHNQVQHQLAGADRPAWRGHLSSTPLRAAVFVVLEE